MATRQFLVEFLNAQGDVVQPSGVDRIILTSSTVTGVAASATPASFSLVNGNNQTSAVSTAVTVAPSVLVVDSNSLPVSSVSVSFIQLSSRSGVVAGAQQTTNASGIATVTSWSLGTIVGTQRMEVKAGSLSTQTFTATAIAGSAFSISASGGTSQTTHVGAALPSRITVLVHDSWSNAVDAQGVTLTSTDEAGVFGSSLITTNSSGVAGTTYTVGPDVDASVASMLAAISSTTSARFDATSTVSVAAIISIQQGDGQVGEISTALPTNPQALVTDAFGNPIASSIVTWVAGAGSLSTDRTPTGSTGTAATVWTLGASAGTQLLTARGNFTSASTITFTVSGATPPPTLIALSDGNNQSGEVGAALASRLTVRLTTVSGSSAVGANVAWASSVGTLGATDVVTDANGYAGVTYSVGTTAGNSIVTASSSGVTGSPIAFTVSATTAAVSSLTFAVQPSSNVNNAEVWAQQPQAQIIDKYGNSCLSSGVNVSIQTKTATGTVALSGTTTVATGATGRAVFVNLQASGQGQGFTLEATSSGVTAKTSNTVNVAPPVGSQLAFVVQPAATNTGNTISPAVQVAVQDSVGATVPGATDSITITISAGGSLTGTVTVAASGGIATFSNLVPGTAGTYTLTAASGTLTGATSTSFTVTTSTAWGAGPNEPAGFTSISTQPCTALPPYGTGSVKDAYGWYRGSTKIEARMALVDAVAEGLDAPPSNGPTVWRSLFPVGGSGGQAYVRWVFPLTSSMPRKSIYRRFLVWLPVNFDCNGNTGTKGLWCKHAGGGHYLNLVSDAGTQGFRTSVQSPSANHGSGLNYGATGATGNRGRWVEFESLWEPGTIGVADGRARLWTSGQVANGGVRQLQYDVSNVLFFSAGDAEVFTEIAWEMTYGGGSNAVPLDMYVYVAGTYISGRAT